MSLSVPFGSFEGPNQRQIWLSIPPDATNIPSGDQDNVKIQLSCPEKSGINVARFQKRTVQSPDPEQRLQPLGLKITVRIDLLCPDILALHLLTGLIGTYFPDV